MAKILFDTVLLDFEVQRLGGQKGLATSNTTRFGSPNGCAVELETTTGLVTITHQTTKEAITVPRERVKLFEPLKPKPEEMAPAKK